MKKWIVLSAVMLFVAVSGSQAWADGGHHRHKKNFPPQVCFKNGPVQICYTEGHGRDKRICDRRHHGRGHYQKICKVCD